MSNTRTIRLARRHQLYLFATTLFLSGALLFIIEPMFAKMALPKLGGSPAVWSICMVCYQALLLTAYASSHLLATRFKPRRASILHLALAVAVFLVLPIHIPNILNSQLHSSSYPATWLIAVLLVGAGLPFFVLSTFSSLLQAWFSEVTAQSSRSPYILYSASNFGNLTGLLAYLLFLEPRFGLARQAQIWKWLYVTLVGLLSICAVALWFNRSQPNTELASTDAGISPTWLDRVQWFAWAFIPSSLMFGITSALTNELPPIPLLWVLPLAIYLASFIIVFAGKLSSWRTTFIGLLPLVLTLSAFSIISKVILSPIFLLPFLLATLFLACMICQGELARTRPSPAHLTQFYLLLSFGGVCGGTFNAIIAPQIFKSLVELPLILFLLALAVAIFRIGPQDHSPNRWDVLSPTLLGIATVVLSLRTRSINFIPQQWLGLVVFLIPLIVCFSFSKRPTRFALGLGALFLAGSVYSGQYGSVLGNYRSFFGIYRISEQAGNHQLFHGSTIHGLQSTDPARRDVPLSYYYPTGPIGQVLLSPPLAHNFKEIGIIGLGAGSLSCYNQPWRHFTFYEIDPTVETIARDPRYFTFLKDCLPESQVVIGDARLSLAAETVQKYDLLIVDAFGSDTIPVHLVTAEAIALYLSRLNDRGLLAFHITNRYLNIAPVLAQIAQNASLRALIQEDAVINPGEQLQGKFASVWVVMAPQASVLAPLASQPNWRPIQSTNAQILWTDEYWSVVSVIRR